MVKRALLIPIAVAAVGICCNGLPAQGEEWQAYAVWAHTAAPLYDEIFAYNSTGSVVWANWDQIASGGPEGLGDHAPVGIELHPNGKLYVCYWDGRRYETFRKQDGFLVNSADVGGQPTDIEVGPDGLIYVAVSGLGVERYNPSTDEKFDDFIIADPAPRSIEFGPDGHLYANFGGTNVSKYHGGAGLLLDGSFVTNLTRAAKMQWHRGKLYIAEMNTLGGEHPADGAILQYGSKGTYLGEFVATGEGNLINPQGFDFTPQGGVLVCDYWAGNSSTNMAIKQYDKDGNYVGIFGPMMPGRWGGNAWPYDIVVPSIPTLIILRGGSFF